MPLSQRDVRNRIAAVKNIQKITRAMEMVAAARLRRAEQRIEAMRPYAGAIRRMTREAAQAAGFVPSVPLLREHPQLRTVGLLLIAGDRGLAGAFNSNIVRAGVAAGREQDSAGRGVAYYASGRRPASSLTFRGLEPVASFIGFSDRPAFSDASAIAERVMSAYLDRDLDQVDLFYNAYHSPISQTVRRETLLPLAQATLLEEPEEDVAAEAAAAGATATAGGATAGAATARAAAAAGATATAGGAAAARPPGPAGPPGPRASVDYEPDAEAVLRRLVPDYVKLSIYRALLESTASEHGARMTAMRNASQNAGELIKDLTLEMNRARQAEITQEIMEVVAGAEGLT